MCGGGGTKIITFKWAANFLHVVNLYILECILQITIVVVPWSGNRLHVADLDNSASKRDLEKVNNKIIKLKIQGDLEIFPTFPEKMNVWFS